MKLRLLFKETNLKGVCCSNRIHNDTKAIPIIQSLSESAITHLLQRGSITGLRTSCLNGLDLTKPVNLDPIQHKQSS